MNMAVKLEELEKAIAEAVSLIGRLKTERGRRPSKGSSGGDAEAIASPPSSRSKQLTEENHRLKEEKKEVRRRIRALIKEIDRMKL